MSLVWVLAACGGATPMPIAPVAPRATESRSGDGSIDARLERIRTALRDLEGAEGALNTWPLGLLTVWRSQIPTDVEVADWSARSQRIARVGLEAEWERSEHTFGPGPVYLERRLAGLFARLDARFRPPALRVRPEWPVTPVIVASPYGWRRDPLHGRRRFHAGIDLAGGRGDVVMATAPGKVVRAAWDRGYGRHVLLRHPGGWESLYGHLEQIFVQEGEQVDLGSPVGLMGSTGRSTAPHLHFEIHRDGQSVDPQRFLDEVGFIVLR
ncbi:MAG: M23 family metallopeptidase [Myxococcota bacterium]